MTQSIGICKQYNYSYTLQIAEVFGKDRYKVTDMRGAERSSKRYKGTTCAENMKPWIKLSNLEVD